MRGNSLKLLTLVLSILILPCRCTTPTASVTMSLSTTPDTAEQCARSVDSPPLQQQEDQVLQQLGRKILSLHLKLATDLANVVKTKTYIYDYDDTWKDVPFIIVGTSRTQWAMVDGVPCHAFLSGTINKELIPKKLARKLWGLTKTNSDDHGLFVLPAQQ